MPKGFREKYGLSKEGRFELVTREERIELIPSLKQCLQGLFEALHRRSHYARSDLTYAWLPVSYAGVYDLSLIHI